MQAATIEQSETTGQKASTLVRVFRKGDLWCAESLEYGVAGAAKTRDDAVADVIKLMRAYMRWESEYGAPAQGRMKPLTPRWWQLVPPRLTAKLPGVERVELLTG